VSVAAAREEAAIAAAAARPRAARPRAARSPAADAEQEGRREGLLVEVARRR